MTFKIPSPLKLDMKSFMGSLSGRLKRVVGWERQRRRSREFSTTIL